MCAQIVTDLIEEIERLTSDQKVGDSNPSGGAGANLCFSLIEK